MGQSSLRLFLPISWVAISWQLFVLMFLLADFALTVMVQCFQEDFLDNTLYHYFDRLLIIILALDILYSFNTCCIRKGVVISQRRQIARQYVRSVYFWTDALSLFVSIMQASLNDRSNYETAFNFVVFVKVIKVYQFDRNIKRYALKTFNALLVYEILKNIVFLALLCHVMGCFFYLIDYNLIQQNAYPDQNPDAYWLLSSSSYPMLIQQPFWVRYTYCFYFSTSILSGIAYGDLVPQNPVETAYVCFIMLLPLVIYSYIFNAIYEVIAKKRDRNKQVKRYQFLAKRHLNTLKVKSALQTKLITYLSYVFKSTATGNQFAHALAPSARKQYHIHTVHAKFDFQLFEQLLSVAPLTDRFVFREALINLIREESFPERYRLLQPGRLKLYYINQGICKRVAVTALKYSDDIRRQQFACFHPFLTGTKPPRLRYESASFVVAQTIDRKEFLSMLRQPKFTQLREAFFLMKEEKLLYHNETIRGEDCFFCNSPAHPIEHCHRLRPTIVNTHPLPAIHFRRPYLRSAHKHKRRIEEKLVSGEEGVREMGIQWCGEEIAGGGSGAVELLRNLQLYYPEHNISQ